MLEDLTAVTNRRALDRWLEDTGWVTGDHTGGPDAMRWAPERPDAALPDGPDIRAVTGCWFPVHLAHRDQPYSEALAEAYDNVEISVTCDGRPGEWTIRLRNHGAALAEAHSRLDNQSFTDLLFEVSALLANDRGEDAEQLLAPYRQHDVLDDIC